MTFLPIVERELRVAARRRGTYWTRLTVAIGAMLTGTGIFLAQFNSPPHVQGQSIFIGLSALCLCYCLLSGRISTADCISEEKREGTLGLLFLTDLKGYDIVLGKLVSTSLGALYGLLAALPVLALPLLLGGVSNGEFWRVVLVLVNTFLLSLSIGIFGSTISRDAQRTMGANFALALFFMVALPVGAWFVLHDPIAFALMPCPVYSFFLCDDAEFKAHPDYFWVSACSIFALSCLLLTVASQIIHGSWQDVPAAPASRRTAGWGGFWNGLRYGKKIKLPAFRKRLLNVNAYYWLAGRARLKPLHVWIFLGLLAVWWTMGWLASGMLWFDPVTAVTLALILNTTLKCWIGLEAGQQLAEDQKAGAMELLLSTPLTTRDILRGQFLALRRQFLWPLVLTVAVELVLMMSEIQHGRGIEPRYWIAGIILLIADVFTLPVVAMRLALTAKNPHRATISTIARVLALPWLLFGWVAVIINVWFWLFSPFGQPPNFPDSALYLNLWFGAGILVDLFYGIRGLTQLHRHFRELATRKFAPAVSRAPRIRTRQAPALRVKRKPALVVAVLVLALCAWIGLRPSKPDYPPPLVVSITRQASPLRVFPGWTTFFILPDGSLWRWGGTGFFGSPQLKATVPQRVGTNEDWLQVSGFGVRCAGVHNDGTLWQWKPLPTDDLSAEPSQVGSDHDWVSASTGSSHALALKHDGTIWAWGNNYGNPSVQSKSTAKAEAPVKVGSDAGWKAVLCQYDYTLALRTNGTLWTWQGPSGTPTLFCRESNWISIDPGFGWPWARAASGDVWELPLRKASAGASIHALGECLASNSPPDHLVSAFIEKPVLFELRKDGTLWEKAISDPPWFTATAAELQWRPFGTRSDWRAIWGGAGTALGLTADGTVWAWGTDYTRKGTMSFSMRAQVVGERIKELLGNGPRGPTTFGQIPAYQKTPRPLLRLAPP